MLKRIGISSKTLQKSKSFEEIIFSRELFNPYVAKTDKIIQQYDNLIKSYSIFISQKEYTKRDYFKITKSELLEKRSIERI